MKTLFILLIATISLNISYGYDKNARLSQMGIGSIVYFDLSGDDVHKERRKTWYRGDGEDRLECSLSFYSRYDRKYVQEKGIIAYRLNNLQYSSTFNRSRPLEYSETYRFTLKNSDKKTPLITFECRTSRDRKKEHLTIAETQNLLRASAHIELSGITDVSKVPRIDELISSFKPKFRLLTDLRFHYEGRKSSFRPVTVPVISQGKVYYDRKKLPSDSSCTLGDDPKVMNEEYIREAGLEYYTQYFQTFSSIDYDRHYSQLSLSLSRLGLTIRCGKRDISNLDGVIEFEGKDL